MDGNGNLIIVSTTIKSIENHIQKLSTFENLRVEHRVLAGDSLYVASLSNIVFGQCGFDGKWSLQCFELIPEEKNGENKGKESVLDRLTRSFFGQSNKIFIYTEYEGKKYREKWNASHYGDITYYGKYLNETHLGFLKMNIAEKHKTLLSMELLRTFFNPLVNPLLKLFNQAQEF